MFLSVPKHACLKNRFTFSKYLMQEIISSLLDVKIIIELYVQRFIFNKRPVDYALALQVHKY